MALDNENFFLNFSRAKRNMRNCGVQPERLNEFEACFVAEYITKHAFSSAYDPWMGRSTTLNQITKYTHLDVAKGAVSISEMAFLKRPYAEYYGEIEAESRSTKDLLAADTKYDLIVSHPDSYSALCVKDDSEFLNEPENAELKQNLKKAKRYWVDLKKYVNLITDNGKVILFVKPSVDRDSESFKRLGARFEKCGLYIEEKIARVHLHILYWCGAHIANPTHVNLRDKVARR